MSDTADMRFQGAQYELSGQDIRRLFRLADMMKTEKISANAARLIAESLHALCENAVRKD